MAEMSKSERRYGAKGADHVTKKPEGKEGGHAEHESPAEKKAETEHGGEGGESKAHEAKEMGSGDMVARHVEEHKSMARRHEKEHRDLHGQHRDAMRDMHTRQEQEMQAMNQRQQGDMDGDGMNPGGAADMNEQPAPGPGEAPEA